MYARRAAVVPAVHAVGQTTEQLFKHQITGLNHSNYLLADAGDNTAVKQRIAGLKQSNFLIADAGDRPAVKLRITGLKQSDFSIADAGDRPAVKEQITGQKRSITWQASQGKSFVWYHVAS